MPGEPRDRRWFLGTATAAIPALAMPLWGRHQPLSFTLGTTKPRATNTGYGVLGYTPASLVDRHRGDLVITTDGTVVEGKRIHGMVRVDASNVTIRGCEIVSYPAHPYIDTSHYGLISSSGTGNVFEYNHLTQYAPSAGADNSVWWMVGVLLTGGSATVYRNNIHDTNDLVYLSGGTHRVQGNYLHDPGFRTDDRDQAGSTPAYWSHNDGVQVMGGRNHVIDGNSFKMKFSTLTGMNSAVNPGPGPEKWWPNCHGVIMQSYYSQVTGVLIQRNWFKYGACGVHFAAGGYGPGTGTLTGNRVTPDQSREFNQYVQIRIDPTTSWPLVRVDSSNVYSNDLGTPLAWRGQPLKAPTTVGTTKIWAYNVNARTP
jgi:hypothetical protein